MTAHPERWPAVRVRISPDIYRLLQTHADRLALDVPAAVMDVLTDWAQLTTMTEEQPR